MTSLTIHMGAVGYPPDTTLSNVTPPSIPSVPAYLSPVVDPTWGTHITRVSNVNGQRNSYARESAWNSDGTKLLLGYAYPGRMLDGTTYADLGAISQISRSVWANTDPNAIYGSGGNYFYRQNATTGTNTPIHTFTGYTGIDLGGGEGCVSNDDKTVVLMTVTASGDQGVLVYDIALDSIVASVTFGNGTAYRPNNAHTTQSGNYVVVNWSPDGSGAHQGVWLHDRNLNSIRQMTTLGGRHFDSGYDTSGNEVLVGWFGSPKMQRYSDGAETSLTPVPSAYGYLHVSCRNLNRPGWVYLSMYQWDSNDNPGRDQLVAVKLDGSQMVEVFGFANHRSNTYGEMPFAVPSRDGKRVLFGSEWGVPGTVYAYVATP